MGEKDKETIKVMLDTNIFIFGYSDILEEERGDEEFIIRNLANNPQYSTGIKKR